MHINDISLSFHNKICFHAISVNVRHNVSNSYLIFSSIQAIFIANMESSRIMSTTTNGLFIRLSNTPKGFDAFGSRKSNSNRHNNKFEVENKN